MTRAKKICRRKKAWSSEIRAKVHALGVMNHPVREFRSKVPIHVYRCPVCHLWHLTKRPQPEE